MRILYTILLVILATYSQGCKEHEKQYTPEEQAWIDKQVDSSMKEINKQIAFDTAGLSTAPVEIISSKIIKEEYSNYKSVKLTYKNVGNKKIDAIKFKWYGIDAFGEPADLGSVVVDGLGGGFDDDGLSINSTGSGTWSVLGRRAKKIVLAWPIEVAFADGTKWEIGK